ncbi:MAG: dihydrolipoamide acetyltransferase family protein [Steroidobacteraceae bacterium]
MASYVFKLPDVGEGTTEAEIAAWHVRPGEHVAEDQPLVDVMTEKVTVEITSPVAGVVQSIFVKAGEMAAVGAALISFETGAAAAGAPAETPASMPPAVYPATRSAAVSPAQEPSADQALAARPAASPSVRRRARETDTPLGQVTGTGPGGRILHRDLEQHRARASGAAGTGRIPATAGAVVPGDAAVPGDAVEEIRVIGLRRRIAEKMMESKRSIPHFTYVEEIDLTELEALRAHLNASDSRGRKLSPLAFFARALARVLPDYPQINATYDGDAGVLRQHRAIHLGVATQTPGGLMVPVVRHVERRDLWDCAAEIARVAAAARDNKAKREELSGSTITLTSLGSLGGIAATPVINHPEVAIIGPNRIVERPVVRQGVIVVRRMMNLSSSFDHRIVDGYDAAAFVQRLKAMLEMPATLFIDRPPVP